MDFEDDRWTLGHQARQLGELRRELEGAWRDELPRELARRYLEPHGQYDESLRAALGDVAAALGSAEGARGRADGLAREAERLAERARAALDEARTDTTVAWQACDLYAEYEWQAREALPAVWAWIERANRAGHGEAEA